MTRMPTNFSCKPMATGFTLVELMIAMAVSLIVALAAVGFVVALIKANSENLQVTRLTQELRSLSDVVGREVRRARYVADPVGLIGLTGTGNRDLINTATAGCIIFRYDEPPNPPTPTVTVSRSIYLSAAEEAVYLNSTGTTCSGGARLSTEQVRITGLTFTPSAALVNGSQIDIRLTGRLRDGAPDVSAIERTFHQTIYVRSGKVD